MRCNPPARSLLARLVLPLCGLVLLAVGLVGWVLPFVPGLPLVVAAVPLLCCIHAPWEAASRTAIRRLHVRWRARRRSRSASVVRDRALASFFQVPTPQPVDSHADPR